MPEIDVREEKEQLLAEFSEHIESGAISSLKHMLNALHPAEVADLLESLPAQQRLLLWELVDVEIEGDVLLEVGDEVRESLILTMDAQEIRAAAENLDHDDLADFLQSLPDKLIEETLQGMDNQNRRRLESVLSYDEDSAGGLMDLNTITVRADVSLDVVIRYLRVRGEIPNHTDRLFVVDRYGKYLGILSLRRLLTNDPDLMVADVMRTELEPIDADMSDTDVARLFEDHDLISAPVVDERGRLLGRITVDDVVDVIREEAEQSVMSMAGLNQEDDIFAPVVRSSRKRAVWLGVNLATAFLASWVIGQFEGTLEKLVTLAVLMTIVPSMGGIAGSQTLTIMIRGQALNQINNSNSRWLLNKEVLVAFLNGLLWAVIVGSITYLWFGDIEIGFIIGAALVMTLISAAIAGVGIPLLLNALGIDPALAGGVLLTTVTDVVGIASFLGLATFFLL